jgi:anti-sigma B factor antagonist
MKVETKLDGNILMVNLEGEVDMSSSGQVWDAISPFLEGKKPKAKAAIINLSKVSYMDSSGIATIVRAWQTTKKSGGKLKLASPSPSVQDVFELAHVNTIFEICASVEEARKGL